MCELKRYWIGNDEGTGFPVSEDEEGEWVKASDAEQALLTQEQALLAKEAALAEKDAEIARLRTALAYIKQDVGPECKCYKEPLVNYIEPCIYHVAKEALEARG